MNRIFKISLIFLAIIFSTLLIFEGGNESVDKGFSEKTMEGEVVVTALPVITDSGMNIFISMDTHTGDLGENLKDVSYIRTDKGEYRPIDWVGDYPGGHHRSGKLVFEGSFEKFTFYIDSIGGENKKFKWD